MEYCGLGDLSKYVMSSKRGNGEDLKWTKKMDERVHVLQSLCSAMVYLEKRKILHRDLKVCFLFLFCCGFEVIEYFLVVGLC